jgi:hypothetical protein
MSVARSCPPVPCPQLNGRHGCLILLPVISHMGIRSEPAWALYQRLGLWLGQVSYKLAARPPEVP